MRLVRLAVQPLRGVEGPWPCLGKGESSAAPGPPDGWASAGWEQVGGPKESLQVAGRLGRRPGPPTSHHPSMDSARVSKSTHTHSPDKVRGTALFQPL